MSVPVPVRGTTVVAPAVRARYRAPRRPVGRRRTSGAAQRLAQLRAQEPDHLVGRHGDDRFQAQQIAGGDQSGDHGGERGGALPGVPSGHEARDPVHDLALHGLLDQFTERVLVDRALQHGEQGRAGDGIVPDGYDLAQDPLGERREVPFLHDPREDFGRVRAQCQRGTEQPLLGAEVVADQGEIDLGLTGDGPQCHRVVAVFEEAAPGDVQDRGPGVLVSRPAPTLRPGFIHHGRILGRRGAPDTGRDAAAYPGGTEDATWVRGPGGCGPPMRRTAGSRTRGSAGPRSVPTLAAPPRESARSGARALLTKWCR